MANASITRAGNLTDTGDKNFARQSDQGEELARLARSVLPKQDARETSFERIDALVSLCRDARAHHRTPSAARTEAVATLHALELARAHATVPEQARQLEDLSARIAAWVEDVLASAAQQAPSAHAGALLHDMAQAASAAPGHGTVAPHSVLSHGNAMLGPVLHTGDEVWAVAGALIAQARASVRLETWAYHPRSESARHIMGGVLALQLRLAEARDRGEVVRPISLDIVLGSGTWGQGPLQKTGGSDHRVVSANSSGRAANQSSFHYGIVPFALDPELIVVTFNINEHRGRGASHSKILVVDDEIGLLTSANIKGSHHRANSFDAPFHDFGCVFAGPLVSGAMREDILANTRNTTLRGSNAGGTHLTLEALRLAAQMSAADTIPRPLQDRDARVVREKVLAISDAVALHRSGEQTARGATVVALAKASYNRVYSKAPPSPQRAAFLTAINKAAVVIEINNTNFNADEVIAALKGAMRRGVNLHIMTSEHYNDAVYSRTQNDNLSIFRALSAYHVKHGCQGELHLRWHPDALFGAGVYRGSHTKAMFIDQELSIVGSANLDAQSWTYSAEFNIATAAPAIVQDLRRSLFEGFWAQGRTYIELPSARQLTAASDISLNSVHSDGDSSQGQGSLASTTEIDAEPAKDIWRDGLLSSGALHQEFRQALASQNIAAKDAFLGQFNEAYAPRISTEEAAVERLVMRENRMEVSGLVPFNFFIDHNIMGEDVLDYAPSYRRAASLDGARGGARARLYVPVVEAGDVSHYRSIVAFEGMTFRADGIARAAGAASGYRAAFDRSGVGRAAFLAEKDTLLSWTKPLIAAGHKVTLTGYSLGGALAARHFAAHTPQEQGGLRLLTFAAPMLDAETSAALSAGADARHFRTRKDIVTKAGAQAVAGAVIKSAPRSAWPF